MSQLMGFKDRPKCTAAKLKLLKVLFLFAVCVGLNLTQYSRVCMLAQLPVELIHPLGR